MAKPLVSVIIPTYNEERFIGRCLDSIYNQNYPKDKIEIIVVDNGSDDKTMEIVKKFSKSKYKVILLHNKIKNPELSKLIGFRKSKGKLIYFGDSDVILENKNWLSNITKPFINKENIFASECEWGYLNDFSAINKYCALLGIADPLARMLTKRKPAKREKKTSYDIYHFGKNQNPVLYCPLWKREMVKDSIKNYGTFNEGRTPTILINKGHNKIAHIKYVKAYHYYVESFLEFIKKRKKIARKHLNRTKKGENTWVAKSGNLRLILATLYCFSIILPFIESIKNMIRDRDVAWIIHPVACFITASLYSYYFIKWKINLGR